MVSGNGEDVFLYGDIANFVEELIAGRGGGEGEGMLN